jgi:hypothetical protein
VKEGFFFFGLCLSSVIYFSKNTFRKLELLPYSGKKEGHKP